MSAFRRDVRRGSSIVAAGRASRQRFQLIAAWQWLWRPARAVSAMLAGVATGLRGPRSRSGGTAPSHRLLIRRECFTSKSHQQYDLWNSRGRCHQVDSARQAGQMSAKANMQDRSCTGSPRPIVGPAAQSGSRSATGRMVAEELCRLVRPGSCRDGVNIETATGVTADWNICPSRPRGQEFW